MKSVSLYQGLKRLAATLILLGGLMATGSLMAQDFAEGMDLPEAAVVGPIQAVESERQTLIVEGRRFSLASELRMDNVELSRSDALSRLSKGDSVILYRESINQNVIERIYTNLE